VTKETEQETWNYLYKDLLEEKPQRKSKQTKYKVGDEVRVSKEKLHFEKVNLNTVYKQKQIFCLNRNDFTGLAHFCFIL